MSESTAAAEWNPGLEKLTADYADHLEKQMKDAINPKATVIGTALRTAFRTKTKGDRMLGEIYKALHFDFATDQIEVLDTLARKGEATGSPAAAKLRKALSIYDTIEKSLANDNGSLLSGMRKIKKLKLSY